MVEGSSPIAGVSVLPVLSPYPNATLVDLRVQGEHAEAIKTANAGEGAGTLKGEDLQRVVGKAKFAAARAYDVREGGCWHSRYEGACSVCLEMELRTGKTLGPHIRRSHIGRDSLCGPERERRLVAQTSLERAVPGCMRSVSSS